MKHANVQQSNMDRNENKKEVQTKGQSLSQIQTSASLKSLTQNTLPKTTIDINKQSSSSTTNKASNIQHKPKLSITASGEIQFFTPREKNQITNKLVSPNSHRQYITKFFQTPTNNNEQTKPSTTIQSEVSLHDEHLEIQTMGGGAGNIQRATQHFLSSKQGNHLPLRQINALQNSQRQTLTDQSEIYNSHYFSTSNNFFKGININQVHNQSTTFESSHLPKSKINTLSERIDSSDLISKQPTAQSSYQNKRKTPTSLILDDKRGYAANSLERFNITSKQSEEQQKQQQQQKQQYNSHDKLYRYNSAKEEIRKMGKYKISTESATTEESQMYNTTTIDRLNTHEQFHNYSVITNVQQSPPMKRKSIEKNIIQSQPSIKISPTRNLQHKESSNSLNEINLFERKKSNLAQFKQQRNDSINATNNQNSLQRQNPNYIPFTNNKNSLQKQIFNSLMDNPINNSSPFKGQKGSNNCSAQNLNEYDQFNSRNDSPAQQKRQGSNQNKLSRKGSITKLNQIYSAGNLGQTGYTNQNNYGLINQSNYGLINQSNYGQTNLSNQAQVNQSYQAQMNQSTISLTKQMCLAATDFQYQKQIKQKQKELKKIRFGQDMFNNFQSEIERIRKAFINKQDIEPILGHYKQNKDICNKTMLIAQKCLTFKRSRAPLEQLLKIHSRSIVLCKQHPNLQLFILLQIAKIFIEISSPLLAIPILKVVKRQSFLNMQNAYLMKAYRSLAQCFITIQKYNIAFGYAAKYLHLSWSCDSHNNELNAYEMLGKIYFYLGDAKKSAYYHNRMAMNIREAENSSLRKMQIYNLKTIYKRRYEIQAAREMKKTRKKLEDKNNGSLYMVSSDDENDLNQLIPEEDKDLLGENKQAQDESPQKQKRIISISLTSLSNMYKVNAPIRKMPKFDIKSDKGCLQETHVKANQDIRIEAKKKENFQQFLKKPYEQFIQFKSMRGIGPMRDKLLVSHKSHNKNLSNFQFSQINKKMKASNIFFTTIDHKNDNATIEGEIEQNKIYNPSQHEEVNLDVQHNLEQSEYWKDSIVKNVEKALQKLIKNISFLHILREELKEIHDEKIQNKTFFDQENEVMESESDKLARKIQDSKAENDEKFWQIV